MTQAEQLAAFVVRASYGDLSEAGREQLKLRILDTIGCAIGALGGDEGSRVGDLTGTALSGGRR